MRLLASLDIDHPMLFVGSIGYLCTNYRSLNPAHRGQQSEGQGASQGNARELDVLSCSLDKFSSPSSRNLESSLLGVCVHHLLQI